MKKGLGMVGLNFVGNAVYREVDKYKYNIATFEFIPWILCQCSTIKEAKEQLNRMNLTNPPFNEELPIPELHWIIAGHGESITVESTQTGINVYDNPVGILTNNPHLINKCLILTTIWLLLLVSHKIIFCSKLPLHTYCRGMGALGLPGDLSSPSRFVRASFCKNEFYFW